MSLLPPCVSVELSAPAVAASNTAAIEARCDAILGAGRCRVVSLGSETPQPWTTCWTATITASGDSPPTADVLLRDQNHPERRQVRRGVEFRPRDAPIDRWATLGLLVAALVTIEEHSESEDGADTLSNLPAKVTGGSIAPPTLVTPPPPPWRPSLDVRATGVIAAGFLPSLSWGFRGELTAGGEHFVGLIRGSYLPSQERTSSSQLQKGGDFKLVAWGAGACWTRGGTGRVGGRLCLGVDRNSIQGRGFGVAEPTQHQPAFGSTWLGGWLSLRLFSHAMLVAGIEGAALFLRPRFNIEGAGESEVFTPPPVGGYASLGLAVPY